MESPDRQENRTFGGRQLQLLLALGMVLGFLMVATVYFAIYAPGDGQPEAAAEAFYRAQFAFDHTAAWELLTTKDQRAAPLSEYLERSSEAESGLFAALLPWVEFRPLATVSIREGQATVTARVRYPNPQQPALRALSGLTAEEIAAELPSLELEYIEGDVAYNLAREGSQWRVVQHLGTEIEVSFEAAIGSELPWDFYPQQERVVARPGENVRINYIAHNRSAATVTGQAVHETEPAEYGGYFQTIECFCFTEQTLGPGEQRVMPLVFRIDPSLPLDAERMLNRYTFYSPAEFPVEEG